MGSGSQTASYGPLVPALSLTDVQSWHTDSTSLGLTLYQQCEDRKDRRQLQETEDS